MKLALILLSVGLGLIILLTKIKIEKQFITKIGITIGILFFLYGIILLIQPDDYIKYTKTTISKDNNSSNTK
jgi:hypothetical protein